MWVEVSLEELMVSSELIFQSVHCSVGPVQSTNQFAPSQLLHFIDTYTEVNITRKLQVIAWVGIKPQLSYMLGFPTVAEEEYMTSWTIITEKLGL